ncbi:MAG: hypothetical protein ACLF0G_18340 [Candidatus Brocadiia bacterium]
MAPLPGLSTRRRRWAAAALVVAALAAFLIWRQTREEEKELPKPPHEGEPVKAVADEVEFWVNGQEMELEHLQGKALLLYFWHPEDGASLDTLPRVCELARAYAEEGLVTIGFVLLTEPAAPERPERVAEAAEALVREHDIPFPLAVDCNWDVHATYRIDQTGTPYCYLADLGHVIFWKGHPRQLTEELVRDAVTPR